MGNPRESLDPDFAYHIFNKTVGNEKLFREPHNYLFFLEKFEKWILPVCDPYCWCLLPNHFHFVVRIKEPNNLSFLTEQPWSKSRSLTEQVTKQFGHCFNSYAQSFNNAYNRSGSLFKESFQRKRILSDDYLRSVINYVHFNPVKDGLVKNVRDWKYSSLREYLGERNEKSRPVSKALLVDEVIELFGSLKEMELLLDNINPDDLQQPRRWFETNS
jgi:REP element-mobilizing transposase RayT